MNPSEFEGRLRRLLADHKSDAGANSGCISCKGCERCIDSTFCETSHDLVRSHYCKDSSGCIDSSHLVRSTRCISSQHLIDCQDCRNSAYLVRCVNLAGCTYCFGCVGLTKKDFHILNEPYDRESYFRITERLARELRT